MLFLPPEGRNLAVQDLDRPPLGHTCENTVSARHSFTGPSTTDCQPMNPRGFTR